MAFEIDQSNLRLPTEKEAGGWYDKKDGENTLDHWAGYAPNPDDTNLLRQKVERTWRNAPLLKTVGSFAGQGQEEQELVFDLGGNVAEWVALSDGKGKAEVEVRIVRRIRARVVRWEWNTLGSCGAWSRDTVGWLSITV